MPTEMVQARQADRIALLCLPFAGAGASFYRAWPRMLGHRLRVVPLQLPGREELYTEPCPAGIGEAVSAAAQDALRSVGETRVALFGHSYGAILAYELTRLLVERGGLAPVHLFVSGSRSPDRPLDTVTRDLDDEGFIGKLEQLVGFVHPALAIDELRAVLLPVLRNDVNLHEAYRDRRTEALPVPITVVRGADDSIVSMDQCRAWSRFTSRGCTVRELPGGHMYLADDPGPLLSMLARWR